MSNKIDDGGPAFPISPMGFSSVEAMYGGLSIRDHFAGLAMQALIASPRPIDDIHDSISSDNSAMSANNVSAWAYEVADAMIRARKQA